MRHYAVFVWRETTQPRPVQSSHLSPTRCSSINAKQTFLISQDAPSGTILILTRKVVTEIRINTKEATYCELPQFVTPASTTKPLAYYICRKSVCDTAASKKLEAKDKRTASFAPSDRPLHAFVSDVKQSDSSSTAHTQRGSVTCFAENTDKKIKRDASVKKISELRHQSSILGV